MALFQRIANLFSLRKVDTEIEAEIQSHIDMRIEDNLALGMSPEDARRDALIRFGNPTSTRERVVSADAALMLGSIWSDVRYTFRQLCENRGFACTAILIMALGVCASVSIFAFVDAVLIKPLPYQDPSRLVALFGSTPLGPRFHISYPDFLDWKKENKVFTSIAAFSNRTFELKVGENDEQVNGAAVSASFFRTLGVAPLLGRDFQENEDAPSTQRTVILSYSAWQNRYGGRKKALGQPVLLDGEPNVIIGVLPPAVHFAPAGPVEFWTTHHATFNPDDRGEHGLLAIARLKDRVTIETASTDMNAIARRLATQYPDSDGGRGATVVTLAQVIARNLRPILLLLLCGALLLLLSGCVNVSSLLLVRSERRRREIAVRAALGASPARLIRQMVTENVTLVAVGHVIGIGAACGGMNLLVRLIPSSMLAETPYLGSLGLNAHVICFATTVGCITTTLFSLASIARLPYSHLREGLAEGARGASGSVWQRLGANLVALELCTAVVLLVSAGLLSKSFYLLMHTELGVQPEHLAVIQLHAAQQRYENDGQILAMEKNVITAIEGLQGVQAAAVSKVIPIGNGTGGNTAFEIIGRSSNWAGNLANTRIVGAGYFATVQARLLSGRYFTEGEDASRPHVMIVNRSFVSAYFPHESPIGKQIRYDELTPVITIVGVVDDINEGPLDAEVHPTLYTPFNQTPDTNFFAVVRTAQSPNGMLNPIAEAVKHSAPAVSTSDAETLGDHIAQSESAYLHRSSAWIVGGFAAIALLLSVLGLYGVIAYSVSQRTREIGVRMALGAQKGSIYRMILGEAGRLTAVGVGSGLLCSVMAANMFRKMLFEAQPWDLATLASVAAILTTCAMLACYIPARRAAWINPVEALRAE